MRQTENLYNDLLTDSKSSERSARSEPRGTRWKGWITEHCIVAYRSSATEKHCAFVQQYFYACVKHYKRPNQYPPVETGQIGDATDRRCIAKYRIKIRNNNSRLLLIAIRNHFDLMLLEPRYSRRASKRGCKSSFGLFSAIHMPHPSLPCPFKKILRGAPARDLALLTIERRVLSHPAYCKKSQCADYIPQKKPRLEKAVPVALTTSLSPNFTKLLCKDRGDFFQYVAAAAAGKHAVAAIPFP